MTFPRAPPCYMAIMDNGLACVNTKAAPSPPVDLESPKGYRVSRMAFALALLLLVGQPGPGDGLVTVRSSPPGIEVWLDGDYIGRTPVEQQPFRPGTFLLTIVSNDSLENVYATIRTGEVNEKVSSLLTLTAIDAGTYEVDVRAGQETEIVLDYGKVVNAPTRAKAFACCAVGGVFGLGAVIGAIIGWLAF